MNILVFDNETTTFQKGNPFSLRNFLCTAGFLRIGEVGEAYTNVNFMTEPRDALVDMIQGWFDWADLIVGFNLKFDLHWIRRFGINFQGKRVYDAQLGHFLITNQKNAYPSLNGVAEDYGLGQKLDVVKTEYWDKGIDTPDIPEYILFEYQEQDVRLTYQCYLHQQKLLESEPLKRKLLSLQNQDLLVLQDMEWNGLHADFHKAIQLGNETLDAISKIDTQLRAMFPDIPINWGSNDHLSAVLYGGIVREPFQVPVGHYKTGPRAGEVKLAWMEKQHHLERLIDPLPKTEVLDTSKLTDEEVAKKKGFRVYATNEKILNSLKAKGKAKDIIRLVLERSKLEKLVGTYYHGVPSLAKEMDWEENYLHGQFNQVVARTGRLSSSTPNLQNIPPEFDALLISRFK